MQAHKPRQSFGCSLCNSYGFTLAETLIVLTILGVIAAITVPSVVKRHMEAIDRTKLKKAMTIYDYSIQKMTVENDLKSDTALKNWSEEKENCGNTTVYFKKSSGEGCEFKTADNVYWDIKDIMNPVVALSKDAMDKYKSTGETDGNKSFKFVTSYDPYTGAFRSNDLKYETDLAKETGDEEALEELEKIYGKINKTTSTSNTAKIPVSSDYHDSQWEKYENGDFDKSCSIKGTVSCTFKLGGKSLKNGGSGSVYNEDGLIIFMQSQVNSTPTPKFRQHRGWTKTNVYNDNKELLYEKWVSLDGDNDIMCKNSKNEEIDCPQ